MSISVIYAQSLNLVIGQDNSLPFKSKMDMRHFRALTTGKIVIMGRKTFESIGFSTLANRTNVVVTKSDEAPIVPGVTYVKSLEEALEKFPTGERFVIGGKHFIQAAIPMADKVYRTTFNKVLPVNENTIQLDKDFILYDDTYMYYPDYNGTKHFFRGVTETVFTEHNLNTKTKDIFGIIELTREKPSYIK